MKRAAPTLAAALCAALAWAPDVGASPAQAYVPPIERESEVPPQAWFAKDVRTGEWCAFDRATLEARGAKNELDADEFGWIRYSPTGLESITVASQSEDAAVEDRYLFDARRRVIRMIRTGHYIQAPVASFTYRPGRGGRLVLTPEAREIERRMARAQEETYIVDWPRYASLSAFPFARLIGVSGGISVRLGCLPAHR